VGDYNFDSPLFRAVVVLILLPLNLLIAFLIIKRVPNNIVGPLLIVWSGTIAYMSIRGSVNIYFLVLYYGYDIVFGWYGLLLALLYFPDGRIFSPLAARWINRQIPFYMVVGLSVFLTQRTLEIPTQWNNPFFVPGQFDFYYTAPGIHLFVRRITLPERQPSGTPADEMVGVVCRFPHPFLTHLVDHLPAIDRR
jgi:hypothetical protein